MTFWPLRNVLKSFLEEHSIFAFKLQKHRCIKIRMHLKKGFSLYQYDVFWQKKKLHNRTDPTLRNNSNPFCTAVKVNMELNTLHEFLA